MMWKKMWLITQMHHIILFCGPFLTHIFPLFTLSGARMGILTGYAAPYHIPYLLLFVCQKHLTFAASWGFQGQPFVPHAQHWAFATYHLVTGQEWISQELLWTSNLVLIIWPMSKTPYTSPFSILLTHHPWRQSDHLQEGWWMASHWYSFHFQWS